MIQRKNNIKGKLINDLAIDVLDAAKRNGFANLSPTEAKTVRKPQKFVDYYSLDEKLRIAYKSGKQVMIVVMDEKGLNMHQFSKIFKQPFSNQDNDSAAIELIEDVGLIVLGDETVGKHVHRAEMFLNSDLMAVTKVMKRLKGKKVGAQSYHFDTKELELKEMFSSTVVRMFFATNNMAEFLETMSVSQRQFGMMAIMWLAGRPLTNESISNKLSILFQLKPSDNRASLKNLVAIGYVSTTDKEISHVFGRKKLFTLTLRGKEWVDKFIRRVTEQTMGTLYE